MPETVGRVVARIPLDQAQRRVVAALAGSGRLFVVEGAAGAGKTTLAAAHALLEMQDHRLVVVTPTLKAARVAEEQLGSAAFSAAWLAHQHGYRWDDDGLWTRLDQEPTAEARLLSGDVLIVDESGMLDQDTAQALLTIADETGARIAFLGDRHQLPAVGRGGVLDLATRWTHPEAHLDLDTVHRFADSEYADLSLLMRPGEVFDALVRRGEVVVHASEVERQAALTTLSDTGGLIVADTREQVAALNAAIRDHRLTTSKTPPAGSVTTAAGEQVGVGDRVATRRNDRHLGVANRDTWTVTRTGADGGLRVRGRVGERTLPPGYVREHVELAYATTVHGAQGETVDRAHLLIGETTGAAAAYVGMTRGRHANTAHFVADSIEDARAQWIQTFTRDRADLGPGHAAQVAAEEVDRYGPRAPTRSVALQEVMLGPRRQRPPPPPLPARPPRPSRGIGR